jgi:ribosomal-protein-alanine N-acetyltransferase
VTLVPFAVCIRPTALVDLPAILEIEKYCRTVTWSPSAFHGEITNENNINLVACALDGTICGYLFSLTVADELELNAIAVSPDFQRKGIAGQLWFTATEAALKRGAATAHLEVRSNNKPAILFYLNLGFEIRRIRKKYYSDDGDDAIVMSKAIAKISFGD